MEYVKVFFKTLKEYLAAMLSGSLRFWAKVYFSICYIFLASLAAGAFTAVFFLIAEAVKNFIAS